MTWRGWWFAERWCRLVGSVLAIPFLMLAVPGLMLMDLADWLKRKKWQARARNTTPLQPGSEFTKAEIVE